MKKKPANEVWVVKVGEDKYLRRGGGELLNEIDLWRGTFRDRDSAQSAFERNENVDSNDNPDGTYCTGEFDEETDEPIPGPKMKVVQIKCTFEEV